MAMQVGWGLFAFQFPVKAKSSDSWEPDAPTSRTTTEIQTEPWKWFVIISLKMEND